MKELILSFVKDNQRHAIVLMPEQDDMLFFTFQGVESIVPAYAQFPSALVEFHSSSRGSIINEMFKLGWSENYPDDYEAKELLKKFLFLHFDHPE